MPGRAYSDSARAAFAVLLLAPLLLTSVACGIRPQEPRTDEDAMVGQETMISSTDTVRRTSPDSISGQGTAGEARLPDDFPVPVPQDYRVVSSVVSEDETSAVVEVSSGEDAYNYYLQSLPEAGLRVVDEGRNQSGYFDAELEFSSDVHEGNLEFSGDTVEIDVESYD